MPTTAADISPAGHYQPFVSSRDWVDLDARRRSATIDRGLRVAHTRFKYFSAAAEQQVIDDVNRRLSRQAAAESVAVEGFYELAPGESRSIALGVENWQQILSRQSEIGESLFASQLDAFDYVKQHMRDGAPITEQFIKELHEISCKAQDMYTVYVSGSKEEYREQQRALSKGTYKEEHNVVTQRGGDVFWYCPPEFVQSEMIRLIDELRSGSFEQLLPQSQIAYAHYALVHIHPFSDGNGRVARALASYYSQISFGVPFIVYSDRKQTYFQALEATGRGDCQLLIDYIEDRTTITLDYARRELSSTESNAPEAQAVRLLDSIRRHQGEVVANLGEVAERVRIDVESRMKLSIAEIPEEAKGAELKYVVDDFVSVGIAANDWNFARPGIRLSIGLDSVPEAHASAIIYILYTTNVSELFCIEVAVTDGEREYNRGYPGRDQTEDILRLQYEDCYPTLAAGAVDQIGLLVELCVSATIARLQGKILSVFRRAGRLGMLPE